MVSRETFQLADAIGTVHHPVVSVPRIASLVPSITELLCELGLADQLIARTSYCIHPASQVGDIAAVGGTKKIKHRLLRQLKPTHVIVNIDENTRLMAEQLAEYVPNIIVTHPLGPLDNPGLYRLLGGIFRCDERAGQLEQQFHQALAQLRSVRSVEPQQVTYLIWNDPWMTVSRDTYIARMLALINWQTLPETCESRYPVLTFDQALLERVDRILFSSEPYKFDQTHLAEFAKRYHYPADRLRLIDGEMTSWYGSRAIAGLKYLQQLATDNG